MMSDFAIDWTLSITYKTPGEQVTGEMDKFTMGSFLGQLLTDMFVAKINSECHFNVVIDGPLLLSYGRKKPKSAALITVSSKVLSTINFIR